MAILRLNFDHAVQYTKPYLGDKSSEIVNSGTVKTGCVDDGRFYFSYTSYQFHIFFEPLPFNIGQNRIKKIYLRFGNSKRFIIKRYEFDVVPRQETEVSYKHYSAGVQYTVGVWSKKASQFQKIIIIRLI